MKKMLIAAAVVLMATSVPERPASAQDVLGGALFGGAAGAIIGGAAIGATTGALIASEAQRRRSGYYWWKGNCYFKDGSGDWYRVKRRYCD